MHPRVIRLLRVGSWIFMQLNYLVQYAFWNTYNVLNLAIEHFTGRNPLAPSDFASLSANAKNMNDAKF